MCYCVFLMKIVRALLKILSILGNEKFCYTQSATASYENTVPKMIIL